MKKIIPFLLCSLLTWMAQAQDITISGKILDKSTREPIAYADIFIENSNIGTISNEEGSFVLNVPAGYSKSSVKITHLGFAIFTSTLDALPGTILLELSPKILDEVVIRPLDPVAIARQAFANIPNLYSQVPVGMKAFYREYTLERGKTVQLMEALLGISYSGYIGEKGQWGIKLLKGRKSNDKDSSKAFGYINMTSVPDAMLFEDLVHKRQQFLLANFTENSTMKLIDIIDFDGTQVYEIGFDQKDNVKKALFKGKMFIETKSLAIIRVEYGESPKGIPYDRLNRESASTCRMEGFQVAMNYKKIGSTWYLNDIIGDYNFHVTKSSRDPKKAIDEKLRTHGELLITDVGQNIGVPVDDYRVGRDRNWIFNKIDSYDPHYWEHINYIVPSMKVKAIADTLNDLKK